MVKILICILLCLVSLKSFAQEDDTLLMWGKRELVWSDFKGVPPLERKNALAITSSLFDPKYKTLNDTLRFFVYCYFKRKKSWTITDADYALNHERRHFDITEVISRKARKYFLGLANGSIQSSVIQIRLIEFEKELFALQDAYDKATNFGRDKVKQAIWDAKIKKMLDELELYKQPYGKIKATVTY